MVIIPNPTPTRVPQHVFRQPFPACESQVPCFASSRVRGMFSVLVAPIKIHKALAIYDADLRPTQTAAYSPRCCGHTCLDGILDIIIPLAKAQSLLSVGLAGHNVSLYPRTWKLHLLGEVRLGTGLTEALELCCLAVNSCLWRKLMTWGIFGSGRQWTKVNVLTLKINVSTLKINALTFKANALILQANLLALKVNVLTFKDNTLSSDVDERPRRDHFVAIDGGASASEINALTLKVNALTTTNHVLTQPASMHSLRKSTH